MHRIRSWADFILGAVLIAASLLALNLTRDLDGGTASSMGPGFVPRMLAILLSLIGAAIVGRSFTLADDIKIECKILPLVCIVGGIAVFGAAIERVGIVATIFAMVILSTWAYPTTRWIEALSLALGCAAFSALIFVKALGLPIAIWPMALVQ